MVRSATVLRYAAFIAMVLFGLGGALFVAGEAFSDPGGWHAVAMTASWALPLVVLSAFALRRPAQAAPVLAGATAVAVTFTVVDSAFGVIPRDTWGPVAAVAVFAMGVTLAFLGLHRAELAGLLMVTVALGQVVSIALDNGPKPGPTFGGSSGVFVLPTLLAGLVFVVAGWLDHDSLRSDRTRRSGAARLRPRRQSTSPTDPVPRRGRYDS